MKTPLTDKWAFEFRSPDEAARFARGVRTPRGAKPILFVNARLCRQIERRLLRWQKFLTDEEVVISRDYEGNGKTRIGIRSGNVNDRYTLWLTLEGTDIGKLMDEAIRLNDQRKRRDRRK